MKQTLEYIILSYLLNNRSSDFIDVSHLYNNDKITFSVILDLDKRDFIAIEKYPSTPYTNTDWIGSTPSDKPPKCKIKFLGIEHIRSIDAESINYDLAEKTLKQFPITRFFAIASFIISIILLSIKLYMLSEPQ